MQYSAQSLSPQHLWDIAYRTVEQLSVTQAAVIGGIGSGASTATVLSVDGPMWLHYFMLAMGAVGATLSVALLILKIVQQRREMRDQTNLIAELERKRLAAGKWKDLYGQL